MPEGPEVATLSKYLNTCILNNTVKSIQALSGRYTVTPIKNLDDFKKTLPTKIVATHYHGKFLYLEFMNSPNAKPWWAFITLGLSGRVLVNNPVTNIDYKYNRIEIKTNEENTIHFTDKLSYGTFSLTNNKKDLDTKLRGLGVDFTKSNNHVGNFKQIKAILGRARKKNRPICDVLLDQKMFAGVGNYIRADVLYLAKVDPFTTIENLTDGELKRLVELSHKIINSSHACQMEYLKKNPYNYQELTQCYKFLVYQQKITAKKEPVLSKKHNGRKIWYVVAHLP